MGTPQSRAPLSELFKSWVASLFPSWTDSRRQLLMERIGWGGPSVPTLEEVGQREGLTRERIRQLQVKLTRRLQSYRAPDDPVLIQAVLLLAEHRDNPTQSAGSLFKEHGLVDTPPPDAGVRLLFKMLGQESLFAAYQAGYTKRRPALNAPVHTARALTRSVGVVCLDWVLEDSGTSLDVEIVRRQLRDAHWCHWLDGIWFWDANTPRGRNRLTNVSRKMLAACGPLGIGEIRGGLDRYFRVGRLPHIPSQHALRLFYQAHPEFTIDREGTVRSTIHLDVEQELDDTELILYRTLRQAPDGFLGRAELFEQAMRAGMNQNTFSVYSSYSPILDRPSHDRWSLRGTDVSPGALEARRTMRKRRHTNDEWTTEGFLRLERETPAYWNLVVSVTKPLQRYVTGRTFDAVDVAGATVGQVRWDDNGTSWGYSPFLQNSGARDGDILVAEFDLSRGLVTLELKKEESAVST